MGETVRTEYEQVLEEPKTLKLFLYVKKHYPEAVGIREALRATKMRSSNTVSRHFNRLEEAGLVTKLTSNRYILTNLGESLQSFAVSTTVKARIFRGSLITNNIFKVSFLLTMVVLTIVLIFIDPLIAAINGVLGLILHGIISYIQFRNERKKLGIYQQKEEKG